MTGSTPERTEGETPGSTGHVLVINAGSSSLKFALVDPSSGDRHMSGLAERLGTDQAVIALTSDGVPDVRTALPDGSHDQAVSAVLEATHRLPSHYQPIGVGHRVVHGGELFADSVLITDQVIDAIARFSSLAPLHNPPALLGIRAVASIWPELPQSAVFDTAFHQTMPARAYRYAVPEEWYVDLGVRKYGFHGTSHRYVSERAAELLERPPADLALVVAHLGNGCSATAVLGGESVDTTMGLTPLEGLVMGTRSGDIDPGVFGYLAQQRSMSSEQVTDVLNKASGLLALSGSTNDMRQLQASAAGGDEPARLPIDVFVYRIAKAVAALVVGLGRVDALVFTGGIGENDARIRASVIETLGFLGLVLDAEANDKHGRESGGRISRDGQPVALVVPTDEELMIARDTTRLISARDGQTRSEGRDEA